jgi:single-stranded DNA-binding protein
MCPLEVTAAGERFHVIAAGELVKEVSALSAGDRVTVRGDLRAYTWNTQDGRQHAAVHVIASEVVKNG